MSEAEAEISTSTPECSPSLMKKCVKPVCSSAASINRFVMVFASLVPR